ncbi:MAG: class I SAM-dependent methyltransferase family protein [Candidatus Thorarchaeota archaeon]
MKYKEFLRTSFKDQVPSDIPLPSGYHLVGHVALLHVDSGLEPHFRLLGEATLRYDRRIDSVAVKTGATTGVMRVPDYTLVAGKSDTVTTHVENGVVFRLDPTRTTFSGGNRGERSYMASIVQPGEYVLDMFACIGQFALPMAKKKQVKVKAIELNSEAYKFLINNIRLNALDDLVEAIHGDCRVVHPVHSVNRVIMGYLHDTHHFLPQALEALVAEGGMIHMHIGLPDKELDKLTRDVEDICSSRGFISDISIRSIKWYAPGIRHSVLDIKVLQS